MPYGSLTGGAPETYQSVRTEIPEDDVQEASEASPPPRRRVVPGGLKKLAYGAVLAVAVTAAFLQINATNAQRRARHAAKEAKAELFDWSVFVPPGIIGSDPTPAPSYSAAPTGPYAPSTAPTEDTSYYVCCFPSYKQYTQPDYDPCTCEKQAKAGTFPALSPENCAKTKSYWCPPPPSYAPTPAPTYEPTISMAPTYVPSQSPTLYMPSAEPTADPTAEPSFEPTAEPTPEPTAQPTAYPTADPTAQPTTAEPTFDPTAEPTFGPTFEPTADPTADPTFDPTAQPTPKPTHKPTAKPTAEPTFQWQYIPPKPTA